MNEDKTQKLDNRLDEIISLLHTVIGGVARIEERQTALENRQAELEAKVDARLRETRPIWEQVLAGLTSLEERQVQLERRFEQMERRFELMEQRLERMEHRQESMDRRLRWIYDEFKDQKMRLRPVFNDVTKLVNNYDEVEERLLKLETERTP